MNAVTAPMVVSSSGAAWNRHSVCCSSLAEGLSRPLGTTSGGFGMHTGHGGAADFPMYIVIDVSSGYPGGLALNQLQWTVHSNGFGSYSVEGSNDGGSSWVSVADVNMNGAGSGNADGAVHTDDWTNNVAYVRYRVVIRDYNNAGGVGGWAVYTWQWNRV